LKAGERIYINGAVLRAERRLTFEILNDATFLLENHILQPEEADTPLRQLYFALQTLLIDPASATARDTYRRMHVATEETFTTTDIVVALRLIARLVAEERVFEALRTLRNLFSIEQSILIEGRLRSLPSTAEQEESDGRQHCDAGV
jgi:flagellar protein FlbT